MKSLTAFLQVLLDELGERCHTSTSRDFKTVTARIDHEGVSFLTITLPSFGKGLEKALSRGKVAHDDFNGFRWVGGLPAFLQGFLELVFDRETGVLLDDPSWEAIFAIRQISSAFAKIKVPCSDERVAQALRNYIECEQELRTSDRSFTGVTREDFQRVGRLLWAEMFTKLDQQVYSGEIVPKHGPGATADRLRGNTKYGQTEWPVRLEYYFPFGEFVLGTLHQPAYLLERGHSEADAKYLEPGEERPVRVITVPKTLKTPRIIAIEPTCMQYVQQGILEAIVEAIREDDISQWLICFDDQLPNRELAREGSLTGALATLDLSEASDRVSNQHVLALMSDHPHLRDGVQACRSRKADVNGKTIRLAKFASMGSALCFPIEAMVFATVVFVGIERALSRRLTKKDIQSLRGRVRIYGDDIIVPVDFVEHVIDSLTSYGMKVNRSKSFWTGGFRESCGGDYFLGRDVTPVKIRSEFPTSRAHAEQIVSTVATRNLFFEKGLYETAAYLDSIVEKFLPQYPVVARNSAALGRWTVYGDDLTVNGFHKDWQVPIVKASVSSSRLPSSHLDSLGALTKYFLKRGVKPFEDEKHLLRAGRPLSVDIKTRWVPVV
jgi:hypothetical protein